MSMCPGALNLNSNYCNAFQSHFKQHAHIKATRNNKCSATLPKINTDLRDKDSFTSMAKIYNDLRKNIRTAKME